MGFPDQQKSWSVPLTWTSGLDKILPVLPKKEWRVDNLFVNCSPTWKEEKEKVQF